MLERIKKSWRHIQRRHPSKALGAGIATGGAATTGVLVVAGVAGGPLLIFPAAAAAYMGGMIAMVNNDPSRVTQNDYSAKGYKLVGDPRDLSQIKAMQEYIDKKTRKMMHMGRLPEKLEAHLQRHIADVAPVLQRVRVYKDSAWREEDRGERTVFEFTRPYYNEKGLWDYQPLARIELAPAGLDARREPVRLVVEPPSAPAKGNAPQALPAPDELSGRFKELSEKVEGVAERMEALEKPPARGLEKPKFTGKKPGA